MNIPFHDGYMILLRGTHLAHRQVASVLNVAAAIAVVSFAFAAAGAKAEVILQVELREGEVGETPDRVLFTPTEAFSEITIADRSGNGITLIDFMPGNTTVADINFFDGSIDVFDSNAGTTRSSLGAVFVGEFDGGWTSEDLSIYDRDDAFDMTFLNTASALMEGAGLNFSRAITEFFPAIGDTGNIVAGEPDVNQVIGQWEVVGIPEPSSVAILALGSLCLFTMRRRTIGQRTPLDSHGRVL